ncbi:hypothetical protein [Anaerobranca gottschalkii]|nr:hypothetical protein [Anaerobranca gottschalkii]
MVTMLQEYLKENYPKVKKLISAWSIAEIYPKDDIGLHGEHYKI